MRLKEKYKYFVFYSKRKLNPYIPTKPDETNERGKTLKRLKEVFYFLKLKIR